MDFLQKVHVTILEQSGRGCGKAAECGGSLASGRRTGVRHTAGHASGQAGNDVPELRP